MIPPNGDPPVSEILLRGSDRLPIPAAARFSVSQGFGCGDLSTRCWLSEQVPTRRCSVPHPCPRFPRCACTHTCVYVHMRVCARCRLDVCACICMHVCKCACMCVLHRFGILRDWLPPDEAPYLLIIPSGLHPQQLSCPLISSSAPLTLHLCLDSAPEPLGGLESGDAQRST